MVLVHTDSSASHGPTPSSRTQKHTYRKYCSPGLAEKFLESQVIYNSWKEHCTIQASIPAVTKHPQNSKTANRQCASLNRKVKQQKVVSSSSDNESNDQGSGSHNRSIHQVSMSGSYYQFEDSHKWNIDTRQSHSQQESTVSNREHSLHTPSDSEHNLPHHVMNTILSGPAQPTQDTTSTPSLNSSVQYQSTLPSMPKQSFPFNPPIRYSSHPLPSSSPSFSRDHSTLTVRVVAGFEPPRPPLPGQQVNTDLT